MNNKYIIISLVIVLIFSYVAGLFVGKYAFKEEDQYYKVEQLSAEQVKIMAQYGFLKVENIRDPTIYDENTGLMVNDGKNNYQVYLGKTIAKNDFGNIFLSRLNN